MAEIDIILVGMLGIHIRFASVIAARLLLIQAMAATSVEMRPILGSAPQSTEVMRLYRRGADRVWENIGRILGDFWELILEIRVGLPVW